MKTVEGSPRPSTSSSKGRKHKISLNESVQVVVRCRPICEKEKRECNVRVVDVWPDRGVIELINPKDDSSYENKKIFTYDAVYDWTSSQQDIYNISVRPLVSSVLDGFNGCVFAYGQTGTGKTYTMEGIDSQPEHIGIIPKAFDQIWSHINRTNNMQYLVTCSYLEIHLEEIKDLLKKDQKKLEVRERPGSGVYVTNLQSVICKGVEDMLHVMSVGNKQRTIGCTNMNEHSSRSHAIFSITIEMCNTESNTIKIGKLNLVDLAGSERQSKTGATGARLREASKINRALSALGNVISALAGNSPHVPYRDSKLTRLLQDSLGGNSKTIMIANIGPASGNYDETLTTLRYANRAKTIKNTPIKNEDPKDAQLRKYQEEIERLKKLIEERKQEVVTVVKKVKKKRGKRTSKDKYDDDIEMMRLDASSVDTSSTEDFPEQDETVIMQLKQEQEKSEELALKLQNLESQLVRGGKNILDAVNENQIQLEQQLAEIAERKKREIEIQQKLELEEETTCEIREGFSNLQQEIELKSRKFRRCHLKLSAIKQEIVEIREEHNCDRREMERTQEALVKELKLKMLVMDNFVPLKEKEYLLNTALFDENLDDWILPSHILEKNVSRPSSRSWFTRPISDAALDMINSKSCPDRAKFDNILNLKLDMPLRTTSRYLRPEISPTLRAVIDAALRDESDIEIDDSQPGSSVTARTQARMDAIDSNLAVRRETQRISARPPVRRYAGTPIPPRSTSQKKS